MATQNSAPKISSARFSHWLMVLLGLIALGAVIVFCKQTVLPFLLLISDQAGPFYLTFSPADLDGDGDLDVLVHNMRHPVEFEAWSGGTLWINQGGLQGGQAGEFTYRRNELEGGWASTLADLDGDGDPDVLADIYEDLAVGLNQGGAQAGDAGVFRFFATIPRPRMSVGQYSVLLAGDIDADRRPDALVLGRGQAYVGQDGAYQPNQSWGWLNMATPHGLFAKETFLIPALEGLSVAAAGLADADGDGDLDLFALTMPSGPEAMLASTGMLLLNDGAGNFTDTGQRLPLEQSSSLALGDLDGDGDVDALAGQAGGAAIWINQGGAQAGQPGRFAPTGQGLSGRQVRGVRLADLEGDGDLEVLTVGRRRIELWWNDGQGSFIPADQTIPCSEREDLVTGDFNGDGHPDIFIAAYDKSARVWFNDGQGGFHQ